MLFTTIYALFASSIVPSLAVPTAGLYKHNGLAERQLPCADGVSPDAQCFGLLQLADYIHKWWNANKGACGLTGFAECWYQKVTPYAPSRCDQINVNPACVEPTWNDFQNSGDNRVKNFYVTWLIWNTNGFILDIYTAAGNADQNVGNALGALSTALDPPQPDSKTLEYILDGLTFGLSLYSEGSVAVKAILRSMAQDTTLTGKLYPANGEAEDQFSTWADVQNNIGKLTGKLKDRVASILPDVQNNVDFFTTFHGSSGLAGYRPPLDGLEDSLTQGLSTWATANMINDLGYIVTRGANTDVSALQANGSNLEYDLGCKGGYDGAGICAEWFYDGTDSFSIVNPAKTSESFHDILETIIGGDNPPTNGHLLFSGGRDCVQSSGANDESNYPTLDPNDLTIVRCLSNVRVCTWTTGTEVGPFSDCDKGLLPSFATDSCDHDGINDGESNVPVGYLGGGVYAADSGGWGGNSACVD